MSGYKAIIPNLTGEGLRHRRKQETQPLIKKESGKPQYTEQDEKRYETSKAQVKPAAKNSIYANVETTLDYVNKLTAQLKKREDRLSAEELAKHQNYQLLKPLLKQIKKNLDDKTVGKDTPYEEAIEIALKQLGKENLTPTTTRPQPR